MAPDHDHCNQDILKGEYSKKMVVRSENKKGAEDEAACL